MTTVVIRHVRHRVAGPDPYQLIATTRCDQRFVPSRLSTRDTRFHEPAYSRCDECFPKVAAA